MIWALNGTASVAGSLIAAVAGKTFGFNAVFLAGACIYLLVLGLLSTWRE